MDEPDIMTEIFFSQSYYRAVLENALSVGYTFMTVRDYCNSENVSEKIGVIRHDIDMKPLRSRIFFEVEKDLGLVSTSYILVHDINYNPFAINVLDMLYEMKEYGIELGLHTNYLETAKILQKNPLQVLGSEILALRSHFDIYGVACHRNVDYMANSLPHLEANWLSISTDFGLEYQAYETKIMKKLEFINEGLMPRLSWRNRSPADVIKEGKSFYMSTHPHWWHRKHAFEN